MKRIHAKCKHPVFLLGSTDSKITLQKLHTLLLKSRLAGGPPPTCPPRPEAPLPARLGRTGVCAGVRTWPCACALVPGFGFPLTAFTVCGLLTHV